MYEIRGSNIPNAWEEFKWTFHHHALEEESRNGPVKSVQDVTHLHITRPTERVLFDPVRDANPFFHVMEFVWMMSGEKDMGWIKQFNGGFQKYSDDGKTLPASYGVRWRRHWGFDQIAAVIHQLKRDLTSRRAVLGMWDPGADLSTDSKEGADRPCNTTIYFRVFTDELQMLCCNRSNDAIWGMFGANCVHMTFLQELVARSLNLSVGPYEVVTNNLHIYTDLPKVQQIMDKTNLERNLYKTLSLSGFPILTGSETLSEFYQDAEAMVSDRLTFKTAWFRQVATPMYLAYLRKDKRDQYVTEIAAQDWRVAATEWVQRRKSERQDPRNLRS